MKNKNLVVIMKGAPDPQLIKTVKEIIKRHEDEVRRIIMRNLNEQLCSENVMTELSEVERRIYEDFKQRFNVEKNYYFEEYDLTVGSFKIGNTVITINIGGYNYSCDAIISNIYEREGFTMGAYIYEGDGQ